MQTHSSTYHIPAKQPAESTSKRSTSLQSSSASNSDISTQAPSTPDFIYYDELIAISQEIEQCRLSALK